MLMLLMIGESHMGLEQLNDKLLFFLGEQPFQNL